MIKLLQPRGEEILSQSAVSGQLLDQAICAVGPAAVGWAVEKSRVLAGRITAKQDFSGLGTSFQARLFEAVSLWALLRLGGIRALPDALKDDMGETIRESVEAGMSADPLLRFVRAIHAELMHEFFDFCSTALPVAERPAAMECLVAELFDGMEQLTQFVGDDFAERRTRWLAGFARGRITLAQTILDGRSVDLDSATRRLGYDLTRHHIALVVTCDERMPDRLRELKGTALRLLEAAGCSSTLLLAVGPARLWAWGGRSTARPTALRYVGKLPAVPAHIRVSAGLPGDGIPGFRRSHLQAIASERVETVGESRPVGIHDYGALELLLLLGNDMGAAADFVVRELGPLAADDKATAALRETLLCYLEQDRSVTATAELLYVAKNTVLYRVKKAEQMLGQCLRELGEDRLRLHSALYVARKLGITALVRHDQDAPALVSRRWSA